MSYPDSVAFLYALGNEVKTARLGLDRIEALAAALGHPHRAFRIIHVAGTNGKGSTCAMIASALQAAGYRTGLYTSPHLVEPTERIQIDGEAVSREEFAAAFDTVHQVAERLVDDERLPAHPTYFETITAMAFHTFRQRGVEVAVVEVGLGGRLDATNIVVPDVAVVTPVDFDHEAWLGKSIASIAAEKAGIIKAGVPLVLAPQREEAATVLERRAAELGAVLIRAADHAITDLELNPWGCVFRIDGGLRIECPLAGEHQAQNALTAALGLRVFGLSDDAIARGIAGARWPGRLERIAREPDIVLDGAHNPAGSRALAHYIARFFPRHGARRVWLIFGAMRDKAMEEMAGILFPVVSEVVLTAPRQARAIRPEAIRDHFGDDRMRVTPRLSDALALVRAEAAADDVVFIAGSLYLIGEAREFLLPPAVQSCWDA